MRLFTIIGLLALVLAACSSERPLGFLPVAPTPKAKEHTTLSYWDEDRGEAIFEDYREVANKAAESYVRVRILAADTASTPRGSDGAPTNVINFASGFIADEEGHVITAAHIALSTDNLAEVIVWDGRTIPARILKVDPLREMAVLRIEPFPGMKPVEFADSDDLEENEPAFAIGTPDNKPGVVSLGTIKSPKLVERIVYDPYGFDNGIELNMNVEPGHSGGPVFNKDGELIGMIAGFELGNPSQPATAFEPPRLAFAVPSNDIEDFIDEAEDL